MIPIVLVGMPGSGKSTVAARLAERLGCDFHDADVILESEQGKSIADLIGDVGEPEFRRLEAICLAEVLTDVTGVLAVGGGAVLDAGTRDRLSIGARVVWLRANPETLARRLGSTARASRPLLEGVDLAELLESRRPFYEAVADWAVDVDDLGAGEAADEIVALLGGAE